MTAEREAFEYRVLTSESLNVPASHYFLRNEADGTRTTLARMGQDGWDLKGIDSKERTFFFARKIDNRRFLYERLMG